MLLLVCLINCNSLEVLTGAKTRVEKGFNSNGISIIDNLHWSEGSHTNTTATVANWEITDVSNVQDLLLDSFYSHDCSGTADQSVVLGLNSVSRGLNLSAGEGSYSFQITAKNSSGKVINKFCSPSISLDMTSPLSPTSAFWSEATPTNSVQITVNWTLSTSSDINKQYINIFNDSSCSSTISSIEVSSDTNSFVLNSLSDNTNYHFTLTTEDLAGNTSSSSCSDGVLTDFTSPSSPTGLSWSEGSSTTGTSGTPIWTLSTSSDVFKQEIQFYSDTACFTQIGNLIDLSPTDTSTTFSFPSNGTYSYRISVTDNAGNNIVSPCSQAINQI